MSQDGRPEQRRLRAEPVLISLLAVVVAVVVAFWANAMVTPVHRTGEPTASFGMPTSAPRTPTPPHTPSPSLTPPTNSPSTKTPTMKSSGTFAPAAVNIAPVSSTGTITRVALQVETSAGLKADAVATQVAGILNDPRSWAGAGKVRFAVVSDVAKADVLVSLMSPKTAAKSCTPVSGSCAVTNKIVIDALSWKNAPTTYSDAVSWQQYLTNHAFGTWLGAKPAVCAKAGKPAPVMMPQQTNLNGCIANPWPTP